MNTFDKTCPQCGAQAIASPKDARNWVWCSTCNWEGSIIEASNIIREIKGRQSKQQQLDI